MKLHGLLIKMILQMLGGLLFLEVCSTFTINTLGNLITEKNLFRRPSVKFGHKYEISPTEFGNIVFSDEVPSFISESLYNWLKEKLKLYIGLENRAPQVVFLCLDQYLCL
ncbi:hypothetical protein Zmor_024247 [Zophobas morio]|uniref:Uncharacterized protein n=1 Tax=Zophobas morio TaxID=2755281 RepID=A0AA38M7X7_9CUCU|nr:hypothetical protein Zmor_024247 [Zophobas morio]